MAFGSRRESGTGRPKKQNNSNRKKSNSSFGIHRGRSPLQHSGEGVEGRTQRWPFRDKGTAPSLSSAGLLDGHRQHRRRSLEEQPMSREHPSPLDAKNL